MLSQSQTDGFAAPRPVKEDVRCGAALAGGFRFKLLPRQSRTPTAAPVRGTPKQIPSAAH
jgi:hypothetical protein